MINFGAEAIVGLVTLGSTPGTDHSLFMLIEGSLQLLILLLFILFYVINLNDARKVARLWAEGKKVNTKTKTILTNMVDKGFPYLFTIPAYIAMIFAIVFPVLVTIFIAFTNYDFYHIPPAKLIDWLVFLTLSKYFS